MIGTFLGIILEVIVATLLLATIAYCVIVNRKLEKLRGDQENLKSIIRDLNQSTLHAEAATTELRNTVEKASRELALQITRAENSAVTLRKHNDAADSLINQMNATAQTAKVSLEQSQPSEPFITRNGFPLEGAAAPEPMTPNPSASNGGGSMWPQLRLSSLSTHGMPDPGQPEPQPQPDRPVNRSRFQWEP